MGNKRRILCNKNFTKIGRIKEMPKGILPTDYLQNYQAQILTLILTKISAKAEDLELGGGVILVEIVAKAIDLRQFKLPKSSY